MKSKNKGWGAAMAGHTCPTCTEKIQYVPHFDESCSYHFFCKKCKKSVARTEAVDEDSSVFEKNAEAETEEQYAKWGA